MTLSVHTIAQWWNEISHFPELLYEYACMYNNNDDDDDSDEKKKKKGRSKSKICLIVVPKVSRA